AVAAAATAATRRLSRVGAECAEQGDDTSPAATAPAAPPPAAVGEHQQLTASEPEEAGVHRISPVDALQQLSSPALTVTWFDDQDQRNVDSQNSQLRATE